MLFNVHDEDANNKDNYKKYTQAVEDTGIAINEEYKMTDK